MSRQNMLKRISASGDTERQTKINDARFMFEYEFDRDISYSPNFMLCEGVNPDHELPIRLWHNKYSDANGFSCDFATQYADKIVVGDMMYDQLNNKYWLVEEAYNKDEVYWQGKLLRCLELKMRWQDDDKHILEYPVFAINSTQYNSGESGDKTLQLGSSQHLITVIADKFTLALNHGKRFFFDRDRSGIPNVFRITQNDTTSRFYDKGLLSITCTEDQYYPERDSIEHWLCDYFDVDKAVVIIYTGSPELRIGGIKNLHVDTEQTVTWSVDDDTGLTLIPNNNSVKIKCVKDMSMIGKILTLTATLEDGSVGTCEITITGGD